MTPAVKLLEKRRIKFELLKYDHDPNSESYGLEAAEKLSLPPTSVFKTLIVEIDNQSLAVAMLPVTDTLNLKKIAKAAGAKKATMANAQAAERSTGYLLGGISPLGQKKRLATFLHQSAEALDTIYVSAGRRGLEVGLPPKVLLTLTNAKTADLTDR